MFGLEDIPIETPKNTKHTEAVFYSQHVQIALRIKVEEPGKKPLMLQASSPTRV